MFVIALQYPKIPNVKTYLGGMLIMGGGCACMAAVAYGKSLYLPQFPCEP